MDLVGKDTGGSPAGETEEAPDKNDRALRGIGEAQELAPVEAMAHEAQSAWETCGDAAGGALGGPKLVRGRNSVEILEFCGRDSEGANDSDHDR